MRQNATNQITQSVTINIKGWIYRSIVVFVILLSVCECDKHSNGEIVMDVCNGVVFNKCYL